MPQLTLLAFNQQFGDPIERRVELYEIDLFTMTETTSPKTCIMILDTFGRNRDGQESIVEVLL